MRNIFNCCEPHIIFFTSGFKKQTVLAEVFLSKDRFMLTSKVSTFQIIPEKCSIFLQPSSLLLDSTGRRFPTPGLRCGLFINQNLEISLGAHCTYAYHRNTLINGQMYKYGLRLRTVPLVLC